MGAGAQAQGPSSAIFQAPWQEAGWEAEQPHLNRRSGVGAGIAGAGCCLSAEHSLLAELEAMVDEVIGPCPVFSLSPGGGQHGVGRHQHPRWVGPQLQPAFPPGTTRWSRHLLPGPSPAQAGVQRLPGSLPSSCGLSLLSPLLTRPRSMEQACDPSVPPRLCPAPCTVPPRLAAQRALV